MEKRTSGAASGKQKALRWLYPLIMKVNRWLGSNRTVLTNKNNVSPSRSIFDLTVVLNNGSEWPLGRLQGKKILLVNTASHCGFTAQYAELQQLQQQHPQLAVIGFPANDFGAQEQGTDKGIAQFCQVNYGVTFPLARKSTVVPGPQQHPVYQWLTRPAQNGWNSHPPEWNFGKYLVSEAGVLTHYFGPSVSPLDPALVAALQA